jgi:hypothetical protein
MPASAAVPTPTAPCTGDASNVSQRLAPSHSGLFNGVNKNANPASDSWQRLGKDLPLTPLTHPFEDNFKWCNSDDSFLNSVDLDALLDCISPSSQEVSSSLLPQDPLGDLDEYLHDNVTPDVTLFNPPPAPASFFDGSVFTKHQQPPAPIASSSLKRSSHPTDSLVPSSKRSRCHSPSPDSVCSSSTSASLVTDPHLYALNRMQERQRKNNEASRKSRALKKVRVQSMEEEIADLEAENEVWQKRLSQLTHAVEQCKEMLVQHFKQSSTPAE